MSGILTEKFFGQTVDKLVQGFDVESGVGGEWGCTLGSCL